MVLYHDLSNVCYLLASDKYNSIILGCKWVLFELKIQMTNRMWEKIKRWIMLMFKMFCPLDTLDALLLYQ